MYLELDFRGFLAEALGTFLLVFTVGVSQGTPIAVGGILWLGMCITGFRSGAQFNPAVSISLITKRILEGDTDPTALVTLFLNIPVQIGAGLIAGFAAWGVDNETFYFVYTDDVKTSQAFFCEMIFTMLLCMNVHGAGKAQRGLFLEGGMIAMTLGTAAYTIGHITRNCINPAVEIGLNVAHYAKHHNEIAKAWLYIFAPIAGGIAATAVTKWRAMIKPEERQRSLVFELTLN